MTNVVIHKSISCLVTETESNDTRSYQVQTGIIYRARDPLTTCVDKRFAQFKTLHDVYSNADTAFRLINSFRPRRDPKSAPRKSEVVKPLGDEAECKIQIIGKSQQQHLELHVGFSVIQGFRSETGAAPTAQHFFIKLQFFK